MGSSASAGIERPVRRPLVVLYAALVVATYAYLAQPGGPIWHLGAELPWIVVDAFLVAGLARGSTRALNVAGYLTGLAAAALVAAELFVGHQSGFGVMLGLLAARGAALFALSRR